MLAVYIDPIVCQTWMGYLIPECWGIAMLVGVTLPMALGLAWLRQSVRRTA